MANLSTLTVSLVAETGKFVNGLKKSRRQASAWGKAVQKSMAVAKVGIGGATVALTALTRASFKTVDAQQKMADRLGLTQRSLAGLTLAAEQTGATQKGLQLALQRSTRRISEAAQGSGVAVSALKELGLEAKSLSTLSPDEQFIKLAKAFEDVENQSDKVRLGFKLFDSEGVGLINTMKLGEDGLRDYINKMDELGVSLTRNQIKKIEEANDATSTLTTAFSGLGNQLAAQFAPSIISAAESITKFVSSVATNVERLAINVRDILGLQSDLNTLSLKGLQQEYALAQDEVFQLRTEIEDANERLLSARTWVGRADARFDLDEATYSLDRVRARMDEIIAKQKEIAANAPSPVAEPTATTGTGGALSAPSTTGGDLPIFDRVNSEIEAQQAQWAKWQATGVNAMESLLTPAQRLEEEIFQINREAEKNIYFTPDIVAGKTQEAIDAYVAEIHRMLKETENVTTEITEFQRQAFANMQGILAQYLFDPFKDGLDGMLKGFADMLRKMVAELLAQKLLTTFFNFLGKQGLFGIVPQTTTGNAIGIGAADSRPRIVGENGPELFSPGATGSIRPLGMLNFESSTVIQGGDGLNVATLIPILEENNRRVKAEIMDAFDRGAYA